MKRGNSRAYILGIMISLVILVILVLLSTGALVKPGHYEAEFMPRTSGKVVWQLSASWGRMVCGEPGQQGYLDYGPYEWLDPGTYSVKFAVQLQAEPDTTLGRVEVSAANAGAILAQQEITSSVSGAEKRQIELTYTLTQTSLLEFRTWYDGARRLCVDDITNRLDAK